MSKMKPEYAQRVLDGGYAFGNKFFSLQGDLLVVTYDDDDYFSRMSYYGTELKDGKLQVDSEGYVTFRQVKPVITEDTEFSF